MPLAPLSRRQRWLFRLLLLIAPLVFLSVLEAALRLGGYGYDPHFFKRLKIGGDEYLVQNEDFSRRFFPRELARHAGPIRFPVHKTPGTLRIFVFGESAAMGDPAQSFAPDRYLEMLLREKYPGTRFEIINVAFTAINSHVILPIARECGALEGDWWIIYMGNNEMVGPFGAATVFGWRAPALPLVRLAVGFQRFRLGQLLVELGRNLKRHGTQTGSWGGMEMFVNNTVAPDSPGKETVYHNFHRNLDEIVLAGINSGAKVLLSTVAVNLKDCPPFASTTNSHVAAAEQARFDSFYTNALDAVAQKQWTKATELFEQAGQINPKSADLQFHWGEALLAQTNTAAAREHFQLACDNDALPFRADERINAMIRSEAEKFANRQLVLIDAAAALASRRGNGMCGQETFFEHVHFDFDGRYRLGRAWAEQIESVLPRNTSVWVSQERCEQLLGLSAWNRAQVIHLIDERMQTPPLSSQPNNFRRRQALEARLSDLRALMTKDNAARTRESFLNLLKQRPEDRFLLEEYAVFLELTGDEAGAATAWQRFTSLLPHDPLGYYESGRMLNGLQRYEEAEASLRIAVAIRPNRTDAWVELGNALAGQKNFSAAITALSTALRQDSRNPQILIRYGKALANLGRHAEAVESYRAAIQSNPGDGLPHHELGVELVLTGQPGLAGTEFREAARLSPDVVPARFDYGGWLMSQGRSDEAQQEFEAVLRLDPGNLQAQQNLARLQRRKP